MLTVGMRIDACPLHKRRGRLLFISTKSPALTVLTLSRAGSLPRLKCIPPVGASLLAKAS
jgi:hypothetical protein